MRKILIFILLLLFNSPFVYSYQICFEGVESEEIREIIESISQLRAEQHRPPPTSFSLKKRAESDKNKILEVMHAFGYYEANLTLLFFGEFPDTTIRVQIEPGPQYFFTPSRILFTSNYPIPPEILCHSEKFLNCEMSLKTGYPARSDVILDTEEELLTLFEEYGYPFSCIMKRDVLVDQETKTVSVTYLVDPGPIAYFGEVFIQGLKKVKKKYIYRHILWTAGDLFNPQSINETDAYLQASGLFSYVMIRPMESVNADGTLPIQILLEEKKFRHIGAGVSYSTDESAGVMCQWSHDNLSGLGDSFSFVGEYSEVIKRATFLYGMPDFYGRNQDLLYSTELRREDAPGFIEREASFLIRIERRVNKFFSFNYGGRFEKLLSTKSDHDANYNLLSFPIQIRWDTSNRLLDPTCGTLIAAFINPYQALFNSHIFFLKQEVLATTYQPLTPSGNVLIAFSAQLGSLVGQSTILIPAPKRFYAGSSTSLRGYKYLTVSPLSGTKPIGGRSLMIFQVEPRFQIYDKLYLAAFFDIGNVYSTPFPRLNKKLLRSFGCGIRYLTPLGPFRLDIGFPIDRRKGIDKAFQIYASIGQTF